MKRLFASLIAIALSFTMAVAVVEQSTVYAVENEATPAKSGLQAMRDSLTLTWNDEFDGDEIDFTKWQYDGDATFRNSEAQIYANGPEDGNVYMQDGCVVLKAEKEERTSSSNGRTKQYTSGEISTHNLGAWKYGYFEIRAKPSCGKNLVPAIWMLGYDFENYKKDKRENCNWPRSGEIDIYYSGENTADLPSFTGGTSQIRHTDFVFLSVSDYSEKLADINIKNTIYRRNPHGQLSCDCHHEPERRCRKDDNCG